MHTDQIPLTVQDWVRRNADKVETIHVELDDLSPEHGPYSIWCYLKPGWICKEVHQVHEGTAKAFLEIATFIEPCSCSECHRLQQVSAA